eukprot:CAMPEP_0114330636 /NCGR_PEP_ID=MMETSP0101-20121206/1888_1 /TAXON_ID=38822 ORGANISM="Pteridomonas danica, Strain PT" /NCGR_SAMPLE_ID=MMETSP0101 /ASSEMBLY_ACC=CAM_ASM_000211 /LENGTH=399 /DNA_ID=CAMNT_0001460723 /DNA_START=272 /DNA_END=1471 /DNA_ORIENTATION=+
MNMNLNRKNSFNIDQDNWSNPIHIDSFEDDEFFGTSFLTFGGENKLSKRKSEFEQPSNKKSKSKLSGVKDDSLANIIEVNNNEDIGGLLMDEDIRALSDSFSDSFDDESGDDSVEGDYDISDDKDKKSRGNYACSKCGLPKRGHLCVFQPRSRRRGAMIGAVDMSDASNQRRLRISETEALSHTKFMSSGPSLKCDAQVGADGATGMISWKETTDQSVSSNMVSTGTQCALDAGGTVRELYLDAQGFPESYANGIIADPSFDVRTAKTITVSRPAPKSYKPKATTASSGAGPDSAVPCAAPLLPPFVPPTQSQRVLPSHNRPLDLGVNYLPSTSGLALPTNMGALGGLPGLGGVNGNPLLNMNHLALLMNSYQLQNQNPVDDQTTIDPALASLFFPPSF